jgi:hypothetical protein
MVSGTIESGSLALGLGASSSQPKLTARESLAAPLMRGQGQTDKRVTFLALGFWEIV